MTTKQQRYEIRKKGDGYAIYKRWLRPELFEKVDKYIKKLNSQTRTR